MKPAIHIIGGTGRMGNWLANFLTRNGYDVSISGRDLKYNKIKSADIIFVSVPISKAEDVIQTISKVATKETTIIDLSSVMSRTAHVFANIPQKGVHMHFLFGPDAVTLASQTIVVSSKFTSINFLLRLFKTHGANILEMKASDHDKYMAHIQNLTHFVNIVFFKTIHENYNSNLTTPTFLAQLSAVNKVLQQDAKLITEIQNNNLHGKEVIQNFLNNATALIAQIGGSSLLNSIEGIQKNYHTERVFSAGHKDSNTTLLLKTATCAYLGPELTNTYTAAHKTGVKKLMPVSTISELFSKVTSETVKYGIVPAQNTIEGTVRETFDLLSNTQVTTIGSIYLEIHHVLASKQEHLKDVTDIYSHPQALAQCKLFLKKHAAKARLHVATSTVSEIEGLKDTPGTAFITTKDASRAYGLHILHESIQDNLENTTRFFIIAKNSKRLEQATKTLIFLSVYNRVGVLKDILTVFANENINLSNIESRPSMEKSWDYNFFIEVDVPMESNNLKEALVILKQYCTQIKILGGVS